VNKINKQWEVTLKIKEWACVWIVTGCCYIRGVAQETQVDSLTAYQIAFDLYKTASQHFKHFVRQREFL